MIFEKKKEVLVCVLILHSNLSEIFLGIRRIQRDFTVDVLTALCKVPVNRVILKKIIQFFDRFWTTFQMSNFMKTRTVEADMFHGGQTVEGSTGFDRQTDRHYETNRRFSKLREST